MESSFSIDMAFIVVYVKRRVSAIKQVFPVLHNSAVVLLSFVIEGWSGGAMVLGKLPVPAWLIWIRVGQGPTAFAVGAGGGCLDIFFLVYHFSFLSPSLWGRPEID